MNGCVGRVLGNDRSEMWDAVPSIAEDPEPEVRALTRAAHGAPCTTEEPKVEQNNSVRGTHSHLDHIMWAEIAVENPSALLNQLFLSLRPLAALRRSKAGLPEQLVELDYRQSSELTELSCERRFAGRPATEDDNSLHSGSSGEQPEEACSGNEKGTKHTQKRDPSRSSATDESELFRQAVFGHAARCIILPQDPDSPSSVIVAR